MTSKKRKRYSQMQDSGESTLLSEESLKFIQDEKVKLFDKKFTLKSKDKTWELPDANVLFTEEVTVVKELMEVKTNLNETKSLLNDIDIVEWHQHTRRTHKAGLVVKNLRQNLSAEMCTQAFAKFYEVVATYDVLPKEVIDNGDVFTVHLCEAPGAFIASMNHYIKSQHSGMKWNWLATTLNPYYEGNDLKAMLDDDRFILATSGNWNFGMDGTGDLMKLENLDDLRKACEAKGPVHLVTADGSIDCADEPAEQENVVGQLIFCEAVAALTLLCRGGCYIFKMFTALEHHMICLMYLMVCLFDEVHIIKPVTSKAGNSEVYVACCGYTGSLPEEYQGALRSAYHCHSPGKTMIPHSLIPNDFLDALKEYQHYFIGLQIDEIRTNIENFHHMSRLEKKLLFHLRNEVASHYVGRFGVRPIKHEERVVIKDYLDGTQLSYTRGPSNNLPIQESFTGRSKTGTYNQRQQQQQHGWLQSVMEDELLACNPSACMSLRGLSQTNLGVQLIPMFHDEVEWLPMATTPLQNTQLKQYRGQPLDKVRNSRFCTPIYVTKLNEAKEYAEVLRGNNVQDLERIVQNTSPLYLACSQLNNDRHYCDVYSIIALDKLVAFTDLKGKKNAVILRQHYTCNCVGNYFNSHNLNVYCTCALTVCKELNSKDVEGQFCHSTASCFEQREDGQCQTKDKMDLVFSTLHRGTLLNPTESLQAPLELTTKKQLLQECITSLKILNKGGVFVCQIFQSLTRFTVGAIYILHHIFNHIALTKPVVGNLWCSERYLVCKGFQGCSEDVLSYLEDILMASSTQLQASNDVLEIVPMRYLYEDNFYRFVKKNNENLALLQLHSIIKLESFYHSPQDMPNEEGKARLNSEIAGYLGSP